jgi:hypothetical protein
MSQILINLNFWEYKQLEYWLMDNYPDNSIRSLYDTWSTPEVEEKYAVEGNITPELEYLLKLKYGERIGKLRFANGQNN